MADGFKTAYGVDVCAGRLTLVRGAQRGLSPLRVSAAADSEDARRALEAVAREVAAGAAALAVCAPAAQTVIRRLRAPFASFRKAAKVWPALLDVELPFPVESALCAYGTPWIESGATLTCAAAIRAGDLAAFDERCRSAGFDPTHCDVEALALWSQQTAETPPVRTERPRALVWLGADHVVVARGRGAEFMAAHVLRASPLAASPEGQAAFAEAWAARARQILAVHLAETGGTEMDVWWAGPGAEDEARVARLRQVLPGEFALRHETHRQPAAFLARALARRAADGTGVNFKSGERTHPALLRKQARLRKQAYWGVAAAATLVLLLNGGETVLRKRRAASVQRELTAAAQAIVGDRIPRGQESLLVARAISRRDEETRPFRNALDPDGAEGRLARAIAEADALGIEISRLSLSSAALAIDGTAPAIQAIEEFGERLRAQGWIVQSDSPGRTPEGRQQFILKGTESHEG